MDRSAALNQVAAWADSVVRPASLICCFAAGKIPGSVFTLPLLEHLHLSGNELSGPIEEFDVSSSCLVELELNMNELTGEVPRSFFKIRSLELLDIESNNFIGSVDLTSFWRLPKLSGLSLSHNKLSVMDGAENNSSTTHPSRLRVCVVRVLIVLPLCYHDGTVAYG